MIYHICHLTEYRFSEPVWLEPHVLRLMPRQDPTQALRDWHLSIEPEPAATVCNVSVAGSTEIIVRYLRPTDHFTIRTTFTVETRRSNPFDFVLTEGAEMLPDIYSPPLLQALAPYLKQRHPGATVERFAVDLLNAADQQPMMFVTALVGACHARISRQSREEGAPRTPAETLRMKNAACRDLSMLTIACCRLVGLAARFVSGYQEGDPDLRDKELHAWVEVYLPGGGWRGVDPSLGLMVADRHIPLVASPDYHLAAPVSGSFRGSATSEFTSTIDMQAVKA